MAEKLIFNATVKSVYSDVPHEQLLAIQSDGGEVTKETPIFGAKLLLARIAQRNSNGHRLLLAEVKKAIAQLGDRPNIPGNFNHQTTPMATSTKLWIENEETSPELWLEAVVWNRYLTEDVFTDTIKAFRNGTLGASFEIDNYRLQAAEDILDTQDVLDHTLDGWALTLGCEPADQATKGRVSITATTDNPEVPKVMEPKVAKPKDKKMELEAKENMVRVWTSDMALGFLNDLPCPECDSRYATMKKADYENGVFEMECNGEENHRFEVKITVKSKGAEATVIGNDSVDELGYKLEPSEEVENLKKEYTDEEIQAIRDKAKADAIAEREAEAQEAAKREADLQAEVDKVKAEAEKDKTAAIEKAKVEAVAEYKKAQEVTAKRVDELHEIMPFESEETKLSERERIEAMSDEDYERVKADRAKDKEIADLKAQLEAKGGKPTIAATQKLPVGDIGTEPVKVEYNPYAGLGRI